MQSCSHAEQVKCPVASRPTHLLVHECVGLLTKYVLLSSTADSVLYSLHITFLISRVSYCIGQAYN